MLHAFNKLKLKWNTDAQANWIMQKVFEKAWIFIKWTQILTEYWLQRDKMTAEERAISRIWWSNEDKYTIWENGKVRVKNQYRYTKIKKFKSYIDSIAFSEKKIYLNTLSSKEGIWLIESDNETYYKVTYFTHE